MKGIYLKTREILFSNDDTDFNKLINGAFLLNDALCPWVLSKRKIKLPMNTMEWRV